MNGSPPIQIALVGLRGVGKTSVGRLIAKKLGVPFVDSDEEIERRRGRSSGEILLADGEPAFRRVEAEVLTELLSFDRAVIALGGGAVLTPSTQEALDGWLVVWLDAPDPVLLDRCRRDELSDDSEPNSQVRPPLTSMSPEREFAELRRSRTPLYQRLAGLSFDTSVRSVDELADGVVRRIQSVDRK